MSLLFCFPCFILKDRCKSFLYGATGSLSQFWGYWRDPWPKSNEDFDSELEKGLYSLLDPERLLDLIAHFIVFEKRDNKVIKKICRYQQYRIVNKLIARVLEDRKPEERRALTWASTGSGKSLAMVFTVLKLKQHLNIDASVLTAPNILVLTDRIDLDTQITETFQACGLPNPIPMSSAKDLIDMIHTDTNGLTLLSTIFKFSGSRKPVRNSGNWIVLQDEVHRTNEKDLGAYLRATMPEAWFFGFTGTPIKKGDKDTYKNFSPPGEAYIDKYGIDDAVKDGATVPLKYMSRKTEWHVHSAELDILFDQWFADLPEEKRDEIKKKELTTATLLKHSRRVHYIAMDIWEHYKKFAKQDGYKAQIVTVDREAIILYKRELDALIAKDLVEERGISQEEALEIASTYSIPIYSSNQEDEKHNLEDEWKISIREDLVKYRLSDENRRNGDNPTEAEAKAAFKTLGEAPYFLIVCSKLLTGFDAPVESVMYIDKPLEDANLIQSISRTNRVHGELKPYGLIVDYVGITRNLQEALSSYRKDDVQNVMTSLDDLRSELKQKHVEVMLFIKDIKRVEGAKDKTLEAEFNALLRALESTDQWLTFKRKAKDFIRTYEALSPDPEILNYTRDLKWVVMFLQVGTLHFEHDQNTDIQSYSAKIREMLEKELDVSGLRDVVKIRSLSDEEYWDDFSIKDKSEEELETAAVRKTAELKKTIKEKLQENQAQYEPFSARLNEIIKKLESKQIDLAEALKEQEQLSKDLEAEGKAHEGSGLSKRAHGVYSILKAFKPTEESAGGSGDSSEHEKKSDEFRMTVLHELAFFIDELYTSDETAPKGWHLKEEMKRNLRGQVRMKIFPLGFNDWKTIPPTVEEYALKHYVKV